MNIKKEAVVLAVLVLSGSAAGLALGGGFEAPGFGIAPGELTEFQPNTTARASEVNANFARLKDGLNESNLYLEGMVASLNAVLENQADQITAQEEEIATLRSAGLRRPSFRWVDDDSIVIDGAASRPMPLALGAEVRLLAATLEVNLAIVGPGGLDGGVAVPNRLYYLYVVPLPAGEVAGIASLNPPTTAGPFGHGIWTYLGAFYTGDSAEVVEFNSVNGNFRSWGGGSLTDAHVTGAGFLPVSILAPEFATSVSGRFHLDGTTSAGDALSVGPLASGTLRVVIAESDNTPRSNLEVPMLEKSGNPLLPGRIYMNVNDASTTAVFRTLGWDEDPLRFP